MPLRYHSLIVDRKTLPECLEITAETEDGAIMGLRHTNLPHPRGAISSRKYCVSEWSPAA